MTPDQVKASYRRALRQHVTVRRYTSIGTNRTYVEIPNVRARVYLYTAQELVGTIIQGDRRAIVYADDVAGGGIAALSGKDTIWLYGKELAIMDIDNSTRRVDDVLIAYEVQLRG